MESEHAEFLEMLSETLPFYMKLSAEARQR
jgi:hypothetical protein